MNILNISGIFSVNSLSVCVCVCVCVCIRPRRFVSRMFEL